MTYIIIPENPTAAILHALCKENGIEIRAKQRKEIYLEAIAAHNAARGEQIKAEDLLAMSVPSEKYERKLKSLIKKTTDNDGLVRMLKLIKFPERMIVQDLHVRMYKSTRMLDLGTLESYILQRGFLRTETLQNAKILITDETKAIDYEAAILTYITDGVNESLQKDDYNWVNHLSRINDVLRRLDVPVMKPYDYYSDSTVNSHSGMVSLLEDDLVQQWCKDEILIIDENITLARSLKHSIFGFLPAFNPDRNLQDYTPIETAPAIKSEPVTPKPIELIANTVMMIEVAGLVTMAFNPYPVIESAPAIDYSIGLAQLDALKALGDELAPITVPVISEPVEAPIVQTAPAVKSTKTKVRPKAVKPAQDRSQAAPKSESAETPMGEVEAGTSDSSRITVNGVQYVSKVSLDAMLKPLYTLDNGYNSGSLTHNLFGYVKGGVRMKNAHSAVIAACEALKINPYTDVKHKPGKSVYVREDVGLVMIASVKSKYSHRVIAWQ